MIRTRKAFFSLPAILLLLWLLSCPVSQAETPKARTFYLSVGAMEDGQEMPGDAVMWQRANNQYYVFLPGTGDLSDARVWFGTDEVITFNDQVLANGDRVTGLSPDTTVVLRFQGRGFLVNIMQGSPIPALFISTASGNTTAIDQSKQYREEGALLLKDASGRPVYDGALEHIRLRGNTSATFPKKNYAFKLKVKTDLLGMGRAKKWVLTGNARDHALLRNQICFAMADHAGLPYTPECRQVDLYFNHLYHGTYLLQEKIEIGESRVAIDDLEEATEDVNELPLDSYPAAGSRSSEKGMYKYLEIPNDPDDITGGYIVEFEYAPKRYAEEACAYTTQHSRIIMLKDPDKASEAQVLYIAALMQGFENAIFAEDGTDPETGRRYDEFVDLDSLVLKYMLEEIAKNEDSNQSSQYFYKPSDRVSTVAFAGPAWDYDSCLGDFGNANTKDLLTPTGFYCNVAQRTNDWWPQLYKKQDFVEEVRHIWQTRYAPAVRILLGQESDPEGKLLSIEEYARQIEASAAMNFIVWPMKQSGKSLANTGKTFAQNIKFLTDFLSKRYAFLDQQWGTAE